MTSQQSVGQCALSAITSQRENGSDMGGTLYRKPMERLVSVSPGLAMIDMKIFQVRLIYTHPILMHARVFLNL